MRTEFTLSSLRDYLKYKNSYNDVHPDVNMTGA